MFRQVTNDKDIEVILEEINNGDVVTAYTPYIAVVADFIVNNNLSVLRDKFLETAWQHDNLLEIIVIPR